MSIGTLSGVGSGVPSIDQLVQQYMAIERRPLTDLDKVKSDLQVRSAMLTDLGNILNSLSTKLQTLIDAATQGGFGAKKLTSQDPSVVTGQASTSAVPTSYSLFVSRLARAHTLVSNRFNSTGVELAANPGSRKLVLTAGGSPAEITYTVEAGQTNAVVLEAAAQAIRSANLGVSASVIAEAPGTSRLVVISASTGSVGAVTVEEAFNEEQLAGLSGLTYRAVREGGTELTSGARYTVDILDYQPNVSATYRLLDWQSNPVTVYDPVTQTWVAQAQIDLSAGDVAVDTGRGVGFTIAASGGGAGSSSFIYGTGLASSRQMAGTSGGYETAPDDLDAEFTLNGLSMSRSSNVVSDAVEGVTLTLLKPQAAGALPVGLSVAADTAAVRTMVDQFILQFNATLSYLKVKTEIDPDTKVRGPLHGDYAYVSLKSVLRRLPSERVPGTESLPYQSLFDIGITADDKGELSVSDQARFDEAVAERPDVVAALLGGASGVATRLKQALDPFTDPLTGQVARDKGAVETKQSDLDKRRVELEARLKAKETQLRLQWSRAYEALTLMAAQQRTLSSMFYGWGLTYGSTTV